MSERELFEAALELPGPGRSAFLERVDPELRAGVLDLLAAHEASGAFMAHPAGGTTIDRPPRAADLVGSRLGPYKLLQVIGEGGFGVVYMAEQERPIGRRVALKVIKPGMDSAAVLARFEAERQALALMDHPNIARVFDAGATESGHPYFVMELVKGVSVTEFCDANHMSPADRLQLFISICNAIQHAHQKGIIHRDIKPTNVLVTLHDGVPVPKVIDFGVAKAVAQKLTERTLFTAYGQMIGAPAYMSPEQAEMSGLDIDTRSDIFSLGVLLYELLTGTTPIEGTRIRAVGYAEMQRLIREEEAPRPSFRLSSLGETATLLAGNRGTDARQLAQQLSGDLDWIVLKALSKDRNRRYTSAGNFADDIDRYLKREVVQARPPSTRYRLQKFAQRNRLAVRAVLAIAAALLVGTGVAVWQAVVATRAKDRALEAAVAERQAKDQALAAAEAEGRARARAELREVEAKSALDFLTQRVFAAARPKGHGGGLGRDVTLRAALESAVPFIEENFRDQPIAQIRLRWTLASAFAGYGEHKRAAEQYERVLVLLTRHRGPSDPEAIAARVDRAAMMSDLKPATEAVILHEEAMRACSTHLGKANETTLRAVNNLANCYQDLRRFDDARKLYEQALPILDSIHGPNGRFTLSCRHNLACVTHSLDGAERAVPRLEEVYEFRRTHFGAGDLETFESMHELANCYHELKRHPDALKLREKVHAGRLAQLGLENALTLKSMNNLASSYEAMKRNAEAIELREKALAGCRIVFGHIDRETLSSMHRLAHGYWNASRRDDALKQYRDTLTAREVHLGMADPQTLETMVDVADCLVAVKRGAEAVPIIDEILRRIAGRPIDRMLASKVIALRMGYFRSMKDPVGLRATAIAWERLEQTNFECLFIAAKIRAVTAMVQRGVEPLDKALVEADERRAVEWLRKSVAAGWPDPDHLANDKDFRELKSRSDFQSILAGGRDKN